MKNFYTIPENTNPRAEDYYEQKRLSVLETIKPICDVFGITSYDYEVPPKREGECLVVEGQRIGCTMDSIGAIVRELITYIFIYSGCADRLTTSHKSAVSQMTRNWLKGEGE